MSAARVRWEHIQSVYELYGCNVSETARAGSACAGVRYSGFLPNEGCDEAIPKHAWSAQGRVRRTRRALPQCLVQLRGSGDHGRTRRVESRDRHGDQR